MLSSWQSGPMPWVPVGRPEVVEVVLVGSLHMKHLAEESLLRHVQGRDLEEVVDAVLQHHTMQAGALAGVDELPYFLQGHGGRHLDGHVLAVFHGVECQGNVVYPVGGNIDEVDVLPIAHGLVSLGAAAISRGTWPPMLDK